VRAGKHRSRTEASLQETRTAVAVACLSESHERRVYFWKSFHSIFG
jgi:hypothetical protein